MLQQPFQVHSHKSQKAPTSFGMSIYPSIHLSTCLSSATTSGQIFMKFYTGDFIISVQKKTNLVTITSREKLRMFYFSRQCKLIINVVQQYKESPLLHFHGNNGYANAPQCYIKHILPTLFKSKLSSILNCVFSTNILCFKWCAAHLRFQDDIFGPLTIWVWNF
jgi:hypothetical protein